MKHLTPRQKVDAFFSEYRELRYSKGEIIVFAGENNNNVYYIIEGRVKKYTVNYKGDEIILTMFRPPSFLPISQAINQKTINRFYYAADTDLVVKRAPAHKVVAMLHENPDVMMSLLLRVNRALDEFLGRAVSLMASNALSRVAYEIYIETTRFGIPDKDGHYLIEITERNIAARTGLTRETVNREIRKLKEMNAVVVERRGIVVKDISYLEKKLYKELL
jgi:CRP-like cAMP-binding protein